jgi:hypothetical protein
MAVEEDLSHIETDLEKIKLLLSSMNFKEKWKLQRTVSILKKRMAELDRLKKELITNIMLLSEAFPIIENDRQLTKEDLEKMPIEQINDILAQLIQLLETCV